MKAVGETNTLHLVSLPRPARVGIKAIVKTFPHHIAFDPVGGELIHPVVLPQGV